MGGLPIKCPFLTDFVAKVLLHSSSKFILAVHAIFFYSRKISFWRFAIFAKNRHTAAVNQGALCPQLARADIRPVDGNSG
jgi:hypothetical protein